MDLKPSRLESKFQLQHLKLWFEKVLCLIDLWSSILFLSYKTQRKTSRHVYFVYVWVNVCMGARGQRWCIIFQEPFILLFIYSVCMGVLLAPCMCLSPGSQKRISDALELGFLATMWVLGIEFKSSGEMTQQLRALPALPKVLSSMPGNHMAAHNPL